MCYSFRSTCSFTFSKTTEILDKNVALKLVKLDRQLGCYFKLNDEEIVVKLVGLEIRDHQHKSTRSFEICA